MMDAILCTTSGVEPWGANVKFEIIDNKIHAKLKTKYTHFQNLLDNPRVVIVYKADDLELIIKAKAEFDVKESILENAKIAFVVDWLRVVDAGQVIDFRDSSSISKQINKFFN